MNDVLMLEERRERLRRELIATRAEADLARRQQGGAAGERLARELATLTRHLEFLGAERAQLKEQVADLESQLGARRELAHQIATRLAPHLHREDE